MSQRCRVRWVLVAGLLVSFAVRASASAPEGTMEKRALGWIRAHNTGEVATVMEFREANRLPAGESVEALEASARRFLERFGRFDVSGIRVEEENHMTIVADSEHGESVELLFSFEASPPHRIEAIQLTVTGRDGRGAQSSLPPLGVDAGTSREELMRVLDSYLARLAGEDIYSGVTLIARGGDVLYSGAHGRASRSYEVPNTVDTRFRVGSITKDFTKVAVAQLVSQGKLHPDDTIARHLPDYPNPDIANKVTVGQLVSHTSGMGGMNFARFSELSKRRFREPQDYFALFADRPLLFEPGTNQEYSNAGYIVLGAIIASASGMPYSDYIERHVFEPAGMLSSRFLALDRPSDKVAEGYMKCPDDPDEWCNNVHIMEIDGGPSGGSYSTAEDLYSFDRALRANRLLPKEYTSWFFTGHWPGDARAVDIPEQWPLAAFAGGAEGVSAVYISDGDWFICVLCNYDEPVAEDVGRLLFERLIGARDEAGEDDKS